MTEKDIRDKITQLRVEHNHLSEYQLSLELGQSKGYIQGITAGRSLPSMKMFLNICEYFSIEPAEFFEEPTASALERELRREIRGLTEEDMKHLLYIIKRMKSDNSRK